LEESEGEGYVGTLKVAEGYIRDVMMIETMLWDIDYRA
jgi:hypothetical protein